MVSFHTAFLSNLFLKMQNNLIIQFKMGLILFPPLNSNEFTETLILPLLLTSLAIKQLLNSKIRFSQSSECVSEYHFTSDTTVDSIECQRRKGASGTNRRQTAVSVAVASVLEIMMTKVVVVLGQWQQKFGFGH